MKQEPRAENRAGCALSVVDIRRQGPRVCGLGSITKETMAEIAELIHKAAMTFRGELKQEEK